MDFFFSLAVSLALPPASVQLYILIASLLVIIGVDASRCLSGGAFSHLESLLNIDTIKKTSITKVHVWIPCSYANRLPANSLIIYHYLGFWERSIFLQLLWQCFIFNFCLIRFKCDLLFTLDSSSLCSFQPSVTLNQDLLAIDQEAFNLYPFFSSIRLRLAIIRFIQLHRVRSSTAAIFLTNHSLSCFDKFIDLPPSFVIPHSFSVPSNTSFSLVNTKQKGKLSFDLVYTSNIALYKHQATVLRAVAALVQDSAFDLHITFIGGGGDDLALDKFQSLRSSLDPRFEFTTFLPFIDRARVFDYLLTSDIFIFASSCEAFGISLLEAMAFGLPIVCSNRSCLPEVARDAAIYFDPYDHISLYCAISCLLNSPSTMSKLRSRAIKRSRDFMPPRMAYDTWNIVSKTAQSRIST